MEKVLRDHREPAVAFTRRRRVVAGVSVAAAAMLGVSLSTRAASPQFYAATLAVAGTWGRAASPPARCIWAGCRHRTGHFGDRS